MPQVSSPRTAVKPTSINPLDDLVAEAVARLESGLPIDLTSLTAHCPELREPVEKLLARAEGNARFRSHYARVRGVHAGIAEDADADWNAMPSWQGCRILQIGEVFVLADHPGSFDSRYFGPLDTASIAGRAVLLWSHRPAV